MKKVLFVASTEIHILHFHIPYIKAFKELGWEVHVACGNSKGLLEEADRCISLPFEKKMYSLRNFACARRLRREIKAHKYDLMLCHTSLAAFFARLAVLGMKNRPAVCNMVHGYLFDDESSWIKRTVLSLAERITAPVTDLILTMNRYDTDYAKAHKLAKRVACVNGIGLNCQKQKADINLREQLGIGEERFLCLYAAEFSKRKSQHVLIKALTMLPENVVLLLPGNGDLLEECRQLAKELGVEERVVFPGYVSGVGKWYSSVDAAVSSSRSEGLPFNIMEAMHYAFPIVASSVKGHTDLIEDGVSGFLYPYGDSEACAEKIRILVESQECAEKIGKAAEKKVQSYRLENVLPTVMEYYLATKK